MKKVFKFLPAMAIILGAGLALATTNKHVSPTWGQVDPEIHESGWVNINALPPGYIGFDCVSSEETCLYYSQDTDDPGEEKGTFVLIPDED